MGHVCDMPSDCSLIEEASTGLLMMKEPLQKEGGKGRVILVKAVNDLHRRGAHSSRVT